MDTPMLLFVAGINGAMALVLWLLVKRPLYRVDRLEDDVQDLRDHKLGVLNNQAREAAKSRKEIHQDMTHIRTHFVGAEDCAARHRALIDTHNEFRASVLKLERVSERTDTAMARSHEMLGQIIGMKQDIATVAARLEALKNG